MTKRKKRKPIVVERHGVHVRLFQRGAFWWLDVQAKGWQRTRKPAKTTERSVAEAAAEMLADEIAKQLLLGVRPDTLTLGQLFDAYHEHKGRHVQRAQWARAIETRQRLFRATWGDALPVASISQTNVDRYCEARRAAYLEKQRAAHAKKQSPGAPALIPLRDGALDPDFRWLSSVCNWATHHKFADGHRLLSTNPLHDCTWPREKNLLRPVASKDRYARTIAQADVVDPRGRLRLILTVARHTARRIDAVVHLRAPDVLLTTDALRATLAMLGHDEGAVTHYPHGAIHWRGETDKMGKDRVTALSAEARTAIDAYRALHPMIGDVPLFPADRARTENDTPKALSRHTAYKWLMKAERLAGLPKLRRGAFHPFRRLWASERKHLPDVVVAAAGGWDNPKAMKESYQDSTPADELAAIAAVS